MSKRENVKKHLSIGRKAREAEDKKNALEEKEERMDKRLLREQDRMMSFVEDDEAAQQ